MCDVPSIAVCCSESIEYFPGTSYKFFLKLLVTIPVALIITGIIVHFRFHISCILLLLLLLTAHNSCLDNVLKCLFKMNSCVTERHNVYSEVGTH